METAVLQWKDRQIFWNAGEFIAVFFEFENLSGVTACYFMVKKCPMTCGTSIYQGN